MIPDDPAHWFLGISPGAFGAVGAALNFIVAITVSRFSEEVPQDIQNMVEEIRVPVGAGEAVSH